MKRSIAIVLGLALAVAFAGAATPAQAGTSVSVSLRIGDPYPGGQLVFAHEPDVRLIPNSRVYYIRDSNYDLYRYGKYWYLNDDGVWFRGRTVRGPFVHVGFTTVPRSVILVPETYHRHWRESPGRGHAYGRYNHKRPDEVAIEKEHGRRGPGQDRDR
jgi:hypothetical protein